MRPEEEPFLHDTKNRSEPDMSSPCNWFTTVALALSIIVNILLVLLQPVQIIRRHKDMFCAAYTTQFGSPILDEIEVHYEPTWFNGSFFHETIYRQLPSPEVDAAWDALGVNEHPMIIPENEGERYGLRPGMVKRPLEDGGGYVVSIEGMHHLHCVDLLRQSTWFNYEYYRQLGQGAFVNDERILQTHVGHCIDILRQQLMCTFDLGVFGQWWVQDVGPFVDFNTQHKCKNFEDIRKWVVEHRLRDHNTKLVNLREEDVVLPAIP